MATMFEDFRHMDVRGADIKNGSKLVFGNVAEKMASAVASLVVPVDFPDTTPPALLTVARKVKAYNQNWQDVPFDEKRDVIAALRTGAKIGIATARILSWMT